MAIIRCPSCNSRMSDKADSCPGCGATRDGSEPDPGVVRYRRLRRRSYHARMATYGAMTLFVAGAIMWWLSTGLLSNPGRIEVAAMGLGVVGYVAARGWLWAIQSNLRKLRR